MSVILYNFGGVQVMRVVSLRKATLMIHRGVARVHKSREDHIGRLIPESIELVEYIFTKWVYSTTGQLHYSKKGVLRRDNHRCAYCGRAATTVDHVLPRGQGGRSVWTNVVAACLSCNQAKGNRTPEQAKMRLQWLPYAPRAADVFV